MKKTFLVYRLALIPFILFTFCIVINSKEAHAMQSIKGKKVVMIIAKNNFRDEELLEPKAILEKNGAAVTIASSSLKESTGMLGAKVSPDILFTEIAVGDYDAVIFVGGTGSSEYWDNPTAHTIAKEASKANKIVGAICIAPVTLAKAGLLKGKKATTYSSTVNDIKSEGANYTGEGVEKDGNIITADGPVSAKKFGEAIVKALQK
ncbi:DJ-1/PfpI family protein [Candidatus Kuenenia sp.]|uniref:DJ-1/PfpI family protein n=1 Tax=Candidatus Kuenenia sp. TaxID=2499824 RepID=UPI00321FD7F3